MLRRSCFLIACLCALAACSVPCASFADSASPTPGERLYEAAQQARARAGLPRQALNSDMAAAAQQWADHLASTGGFYHAPGRMEIIAWSGATNNEQVGINTWLGSPAHVAFLLGNTKECGYGMATVNGRTLYCGIFSRAKPVLHAITHPVNTVTTAVNNVRNRHGLFGRRK